MLHMHNTWGLDYITKMGIEIEIDVEKLIPVGQLVRNIV